MGGMLDFEYPVLLGHFSDPVIRPDPRCHFKHGESVLISSQYNRSFYNKDHIFLPSNLKNVKII